MADKIYCGSGKEKTFENGGSIISISVALEDYPKEFLTEYNGKRYLRLDVCRKREIDQYGKSHYVSVNTWQPDAQQSQSRPTAQPASGHNTTAQADFEDDIPF